MAQDQQWNLTKNVNHLHQMRTQYISQFTVPTAHAPIVRKWQSADINTPLASTNAIQITLILDILLNVYFYSKSFISCMIYFTTKLNFHSRFLKRMRSHYTTSVIFNLLDLFKNIFEQLLYIYNRISLLLSSLSMIMKLVKTLVNIKHPNFYDNFGYAHSCSSQHGTNNNC